MPVRPMFCMLLHRMALVSFRLFCKNLCNLQEFFGQMVYRPPSPKIVRTPMLISIFFLLPGENGSISFSWLANYQLFFAVKKGRNRHPWQGK